jgi:hypothetical protein
MHTNYVTRSPVRIGINNAHLVIHFWVVRMSSKPGTNRVGAIATCLNYS